MQNLFPQRAINALVASAGTGDIKFVKFYIKEGIDIDGLADGFGDLSYDFDVTALMAAAYGGQLEIVKYLVNKGADINIRSGSVSAKDMAIKSLSDWETGRISSGKSEQKIENLRKIIKILT